MSTDCEHCGRRPATIRYAEMVNGELCIWNLCEECARRKGVGGSLTSFATPLVDVLMGLLGESPEQVDEDAGPACPRCGMSYADFRRSGRLGCGACYETFRKELLPLVRRIHGSTQHTGRIPASHEEDAAAKSELRRLRAELRRAVRREEYERAAELRDLIRAKEAGDAGSEARDVDVRDDGR
jgi:protein arginine kinase activator